MTKFIAMIALVVMMFAASPQVAIAKKLPMKAKCYLDTECQTLVGKVLFPTYCEKLGAKCVKPIEKKSPMKAKCYLDTECQTLVGKVLFPTYCEKLGAKSMKQINLEGANCVPIGCDQK